MELKNYVMCKSFFSKMKGLMFTFKPKILVMVFEKDQFVPLHMWFVFYPIDVLYLNSDKQVIEIKEKFKPFEIYNPNKKARYVVELPSGLINKNQIKINEKIIFS